MVRLSLSSHGLTDLNGADYNFHHVLTRRRDIVSSSCGEEAFFGTRAPSSHIRHAFRAAIGNAFLGGLANAGEHCNTVFAATKDGLSEEDKAEMLAHWDIDGYQAPQGPVRVNGPYEKEQRLVARTSRSIHESPPFPKEVQSMVGQKGNQVPSPKKQGMQLGAHTNPDGSIENILAPPHPPFLNKPPNGPPNGPLPPPDGEDAEEFALAEEVAHMTTPAEAEKVLHKLDPNEVEKAGMGPPS